MRARPGFTLIEMMVTVAIVGILAVLALGLSKKGLRNGRLNGSVHQLAVQAESLRMLALRDQTDYALVVSDAPGGDARSCETGTPSQCARYFILRHVDPDWDPNTFNPNNIAASMANCDAGAGACFVASYALPKGVALATSNTPPPLPVGDAGVPAVSGSTHNAIRFNSSGQASLIGNAAAPGFVMYWGTEDATATTDPGKVAEVTGILIGFPSGFVRTFHAY